MKQCLHLTMRHRFLTPFSTSFGLISAVAAAFLFANPSPAQGPQVGDAYVCNGRLQASPNCDDDGAETSSGSMIYVDKHGAVAMPDDWTGTFWVTGYDDVSKAVSDAKGNCEKATGKSCFSRGNFRNQCLTYSEDDASEYTYAGYGKSPDKAAKMAMSECRKDGGGKCSLRLLPICSGIQYSGGANKRAANATPADIEALSAKYRR